NSSSTFKRHSCPAESFVPNGPGGSSKGSLHVKERASVFTQSRSLGTISALDYYTTIFDALLHRN
ncbi:MAG: hypothetical protein WBW71_15675, partial [Bacteroidota bacterium]